MKNKKVFKNLLGEVITKEDRRINEEIVKKARKQLKHENEILIKKGLPPKKYAVVSVWLKGIVVDYDGIQRETKETTISKIIADFDTARVDIKSVYVDADGYLSCFDGCHTLLSLLLKGYEWWEMKVYPDIDITDAAKLFVDQFLNCLRIKPIDALKAGLTANLKYAKDIYSACEDRQITLKFSGVKQESIRNITAISTLLNIWRRYKKEGVELTLDTIIDAGWGQYVHGFSNVFLSAGETMYKILQYKGEDKDGDTYKKLIAIMKQYNPDGFLGEAKKSVNVNKQSAMHGAESAMRTYMKYLAGICNLEGVDYE